MLTCSSDASGVREYSLYSYARIWLVLSDWRCKYCTVYEDLVLVIFNRVHSYKLVLQLVVDSAWLYTKRTAPGARYFPHEHILIYFIRYFIYLSLLDCTP